MHISYDEIISTILSYITTILGIAAVCVLLISLGPKAEAMTKETSTTYISQLEHSNMIPSKSNKPTMKNTVFHLRQGDYSEFDLHSLPNALKYDGSTIMNKDNYSFYGNIKIKGSENGVNHFRLIVKDDEGNTGKFNISILIEGDDSPLDPILTYQEGALK